MNRIHSSAIIESGAQLGSNVRVGPFSIVHSGVVIGDNSEIGSHCEIGVPAELSDQAALEIGRNANIRSHSVLYSGSIIGDNLSTGHRVTIRENARIGVDFQLGTLGDIQGDCQIGNYVRTHSNVHIGKKTKIGNFVWIFPYTVFTNDPHPPSDVMVGATVEDYAVITTMCVILPGVNIGKKSLVAAKSLVTKDVLEGKIVAGSPAKELGPTSKVKYSGQLDISAYPWTQHFRRGYPKEVIESWIEEDKSEA